MDIPYLSRKFILSTSLALVGTAFMWLRYIQPEQWMWVMMSTVVSYVAANAIQKKTGGDASNIHTNYNDKRVSIVTIWDRLQALFSRTFLLCMVTIVICSLFLYKGIVPANVWFSICSALAAAYNIGNSIGKID